MNRGNRRDEEFITDQDRQVFWMHLNPIRTRRFEKAEFSKICDYLKIYPWSSFPGYCYLRKRTPTIDTVIISKKKSVPNLE